MTAVPLELPMKASEAAALADLIYQHAEGKPLTDELRTRLGGRASTLGLTSLHPFARSLQRDPVHLSTYYIAVESRKDERPQSWLLRIAPASAPASGLFPQALLIGRMRPGGGREIVVNAVSFSPQDSAHIRTFAEQVDPSVFPRPQGSQSSIVAGACYPLLTIPAAFEAFRSVLKTTRVNLACPAQLSAADFERFGTTPERLFETTLWAAIRAGWRDNYSAEAGPFVMTPAEGLERALEASKHVIAKCAGFTRFSIDVSALSGADLWRAVDSLVDAVHETRNPAGLGRGFDLELSLANSADLTSSEQLHQLLEGMRSRGRAVQFIAPNIGFREGYPFSGSIEELRERVTDLAAAARGFNTTLTFAGGSGKTAEVLEAIGRAASGRFCYKVSAELQFHLFDLLTEQPPTSPWRQMFARLAASCEPLAPGPRTLGDWDWGRANGDLPFLEALSRATTAADTTAPDGDTRTFAEKFADIPPAVADEFRKRVARYLQWLAERLRG